MPPAGGRGAGQPFGTDSAPRTAARAPPARERPSHFRGPSFPPSFPPAGDPSFPPAGLGGKTGAPQSSAGGKDGGKDERLLRPGRARWPRRRADFLKIMLGLGRGHGWSQRAAPLLAEVAPIGAKGGRACSHIFVSRKSCFSQNLIIKWYQRALIPPAL